MSKIINSGLDQYGAEPFERQRFGTAGVKGVKTLYIGRNRSNFKDHYGDATKGQCLGITAEINVFSASGEML